MLLINDYKKIFYCPMRKNRLAKLKDSEDAYQPLRSFEWSEADLSHGKLIRLKGMPEHLLLLLLMILHRHVLMTRKKFVPFDGMWSNFIVKSNSSLGLINVSVESNVFNAIILPALFMCELT